MHSAGPPLPSIMCAKSMMCGSASSADRQHHRAGAIAEQHARRAVGVVDDARHHVGADRERVIARAGGDHLHRRRQRIGEPGAGGAEVEAPGVVGADLRLQHARGARKDRVRRRGADDDEAELVGGDAGLAHRPFGGDLGEVRGADAGLGDVALADAGALQDPLVGGVDQLLEVRVGQHPRRHVGGQAGDLDGAELPGSAAIRPMSCVYQSLSLCGAVRPKYS